MTQKRNCIEKMRFLLPLSKYMILWTPVIYKGRKIDGYMINQYSEIKSLKHKDGELLLSPIKVGNDLMHLQYELCDNGEKIMALAYIAAWESFTGYTLPKGYILHHKDGDPDNNFIGNFTPMLRSRHTRKHCEKAILQLDKETGKVIKRWSSMKKAAAEFGKPYTNISSCCRGKTKTAFGFGWKYA